MTIDFYETMSEVNKRLSLSTAYKTWRLEWHDPHMEIVEYAAIFSDTCFLISEYVNNLLTPEQEKEVVKRLFYILSTSQDETMSLATLVSKLDVDCPAIAEEYEDNMNHYANIVFNLKNLGIFHYSETTNGHPVISPILQVKGELRSILHSKFGSAIPQIGDVVGEMDSKGIRFSGQSTKRDTPLNQYDREAVSMVSRQRFKVAIDIINKMEYYVPTLSRTGEPISPREQEYVRTDYYRFVDMAEYAHEENTVIQFPTTQDSRGRFYNAATDPAVRLSLRSPEPEGSLTEFEHNLINR